MGSKGKQRQAVQSAKLVTKRENAKSGKQSKYAQKKARGNPSPSSPFHYDPNDPTHETIEEARKNEFLNHPHRNFVREDPR